MTTEVTQDAVKNTVENKKGKRGFTLTEIAIVLGIMGLILGSIWVAAAAVYANLNTSKTQTELLTIVQNVRAMYATSATVDTGADMTGFGSQTTTATQTYISANVFPGDMVITGGGSSSAQDPWNGYANIHSETNATAADSFMVSFSNLPASACITLATRVSGSGRDPGLYNIGVVAGAAALPGSAVPGNVPLTASAAQALCSGVAAPVSIGFSFKLKT